MSELILKIENNNWGGWKSVRVHRSIRQGADIFELSLTDRWFGNPNARRIRSDAASQILLDGEAVITGYVFDAIPDYDDQDHTINVTGFSKCKDLVDCSLKGRQFKGRTLLQIASELARPFGISVHAQADIGGAFQKVMLESGQSIFSFLDELSRIRGVRIVSLPNGDIAFIRTGTQKAPTALVLGQNAKRAGGRFSSEDRFSEYTVLGQSAGTDDWNGEQAAHAEAVEHDSSMRYRPFTLIADGPANGNDVKTRALIEKNRRFGESRGITYTVQGWRHKGILWRPNTLVDIDDSYLNIKETWLIASVDYVIDDNGTYVELEVAPTAAFDMTPLRESTANSGGW